MQEEWSRRYAASGRKALFAMGFSQYQQAFQILCFNIKCFPGFMEGRQNILAV